MKFKILMNYLININYIIIKLMLLNIVINKNRLRKIFKKKLNQFKNRLKILNQIKHQRLRSKEKIKLLKTIFYKILMIM